MCIQTLSEYNARLGSIVIISLRLGEMITHTRKELLFVLDIVLEPRQYSHPLQILLRWPGYHSIG